MTLTEGVVRADAVSVRDGRLAVAVHLPWYRSLPISCLESLTVAVDGVPAAVRAVAVPGFTGTIGDAAGSDAWWDLRDALEVVLDVPAPAGGAIRLTVTVAVRIPYIRTGPDVALVQRVVVDEEVLIP